MLSKMLLGREEWFDNTPEKSEENDTNTTETKWVINKSRTNRQREMETKLNNKHLGLSVVFYLVSVHAFGNKLFQNEATK